MNSLAACAKFCPKLRPFRHRLQFESSARCNRYVRISCGEIAASPVARSFSLPGSFWRAFLWPVLFLRIIVDAPHSRSPFLAPSNCWLSADGAAASLWFPFSLVNRFLFPPSRHEATSLTRSARLAARFVPLRSYAPNAGCWPVLWHPRRQSVCGLATRSLALRERRLGDSAGTGGYGAPPATATRPTTATATAARLAGEACLCAAPPPHQLKLPTHPSRTI